MFSFAKEVGVKPPHKLVNMLREDADKQITPLFVKPMNVLADLIIHEQDIRIALGKHKTIDADILRVIFETFTHKSFGLGERLVGVNKNIKGLQLIAEDIGWTYGTSSFIVRGRAQDVLMTIVGRKARLKALTGNGVAILEQRLSSSQVSQ